MPHKRSERDEKKPTVAEPPGGEDVAERLLNFAVSILRLANSLPESRVGRHVFGQIVRSATAAGIHYDKAPEGRHSPDIAQRQDVVLTELRETRYWLTIIRRANLVPPARVKDIIEEADTLCRIVDGEPTALS